MPMGALPALDPDSSGSSRGTAAAVPIPLADGTSAPAGMGAAQIDVRAYGDGLLGRHAEQLVASGISSEVARERGYRSVSTKAELKRLGFGERQLNAPTLLIPLHGVNGDSVGYQSRPDEPRVANGKPIKYETPSGSRMVLDVHPRARMQIGDPKVPILITEGIKKGDAAVSRGLCCVALLGVWNWRGTNEHGGKVALSDWESVALNGRSVYVVFDSDLMEKPPVYQALVRLKDFLKIRHAVVRLIYLPPGPVGEKVGLDDFLALGKTVEDLLALATDQLRPAPNQVNRARGLPYRETEAGIVWDKETRDGRVEVPLTNFTARIAAQIVRDDGVEEHRELEIAAKVAGQACLVRIPASSFEGAAWVIRYLGAEAVISPGFGARDHVRAAIQLLSGKIPERRVFAHTGWRRIGGTWFYLVGGGAIGRDGRATDIVIELPEALGLFELPDPPNGELSSRAVRAALRILDMAPDRVMVPLLGAVCRAVLGDSDVSLHLSGPTGTGKTAIAAVIQQFFGARMDAKHLPASWSSTANSLEETAFAAKDALLVVDDFAPTGSLCDVQRLHREADRLLRAVGNRAGRQRMRADCSQRPIRPPRGLIVSTGEDVPRGQSLRARLLVLQAAREDLNWSVLTEVQSDTAAGLRATAMSGFVRWVAAHYEELRRFGGDREAALRGAMSRGTHRRTPSNLASVALGWEAFLSWTREDGLLGQTEIDTLWRRVLKTLSELAGEQGEQISQGDPARRFVELLGQVLAAGRAHVATTNGGRPESAEVWGWRWSPDGDEWRALGNLVGWVNGEGVFLLPDAAYAAVQALGREGGEQISVTIGTLKRRLREGGFLQAVDEARETLTVRRTIGGVRRDVLHLSAASLQCNQPDQPDHDRQGQPTGRITGMEWSGPGQVSAKTRPPQVPPLEKVLLNWSGWSGLLIPPGEVQRQTATAGVLSGRVPLRRNPTRCPTRTRPVKGAEVRGKLRAKIRSPSSTPTLRRVLR